MNIWLLLSMILDIYPWIVLQYLPFRKKLRCSVTLAAAVETAALLSYQLAVSCCASSFDNVSILMLRVGQFLVMVATFHWLVRDRFDKKAFVVGMLFPLTVFVSSLGSWCVSWVRVETPPFMVASLVRLAVSAAMYPLLYRFWRWKLIPVLEGPNQVVSRYCWPLMALFTLATVMSLRPGAEIVGTTFSMVLVRLAIFLGMVYVNRMAVKISVQVERRIRMEEEVEKNWLLIGTQTEQYRVLTEKLRQAEENRSNARQHLAAIRTLAEADGAEDVKAYIDNLLRDVAVEPQKPLCENRTANAILSYYGAWAEKEEIPLEIQVEIPQDLAINGTDLCIVIGNLFENAIEASLSLPPDRRELRVGIRTRRSSLEIHFENRFGGEIHQENGKILSAKREFRQCGVGIPSVWAVADKYDGELSIRHDKGVFTVDVVLQESDEKFFGKSTK